MKRYEITYMKNGEIETIDVYGVKNLETFIEKNKEFINNIDVEEFDILEKTQKDEDKEEEAFNDFKEEIENLISKDGMSNIEVALILCGAVGMIKMCHEKFECSFSENLIEKFEKIFIQYRYGK